MFMNTLQIHNSLHQAQSILLRNQQFFILSKDSLPCTAHEHSIPCWQQLTSSSYPQPHISVQSAFNSHFNIIIPSYPSTPCGHISSGFPAKNFSCISLLPMCATCSAHLIFFDAFILLLSGRIYTVKLLNAINNKPSKWMSMAPPI